MKNDGSSPILVLGFYVIMVLVELVETSRREDTKDVSHKDMKIL